MSAKTWLTSAFFMAAAITAAPYSEAATPTDEGAHFTAAQFHVTQAQQTQVRHDTDLMSGPDDKDKTDLARITVGELFDDVDNKSETLVHATRSIIRHLRQKQIFPARNGQTVQDVMAFQRNLSNWMEEYYGKPMAPNDAAFEATIDALVDAYEENKDQTLMNVIMAHVFDTIKAGQKSAKRMTPPPQDHSPS